MLAHGVEVRTWPENTGGGSAQGTKPGMQMGTRRRV